MSHTELLRCPHCENLSKMEIVGTANDQIDEYGDPEMGAMVADYNCYETSKCPNCSKVVIRKYYWHDSMEGEADVSYQLLYPIVRENPKGLPENIGKAYIEIERVKRVSVPAYVGQVRRLLEMVCIDRKATKGPLGARLKQLSDHGEIPAKLIMVAETLSELGHMGAHADLGDLSEDEIPIVDSLCRAILEYVYGAPHLALTAEAKLGEIRARRKRERKV